MASVELLFEPFKSRNLALPNRLVMAPMTRSKSPGGVPGEDVARYYRRRAEGGVGLILTEGTAPDHPSATGDANVPHFYGAGLFGWKRVVDEVHAAGGKIMPQLWHVGSTRNPNETLNVPPVSPSGLNGNGQKTSEPLTESEIADLIAGYVRSAVSAQRLGFDGVELHGAHGYLIDQFFWDKTNQRTDHWGGTLSARSRFAVEVVSAIRKAVGPDFPLLFRFSQWKIADFNAKIARTPHELSILLGSLVAAGVDILHASTRRFWEPEFPGSALNLAGWARKLSGVPVITVGSVGLSDEFIGSYRGEKRDVAPIDELLRRLENKEFDLVAVGRMMIAEPDWPKKVREGITTLKPFSRELLATLE